MRRYLPVNDDPCWLKEQRAAVEGADGARVTVRLMVCPNCRENGHQQRWVVYRPQGDDRWHFLCERCERAFVERPAGRSEGAAVELLLRWLTEGDAEISAELVAREAAAALADAVHREFGAGLTGADILRRWPKPVWASGNPEPTLERSAGEVLSANQVSSAEQPHCAHCPVAGSKYPCPSRALSHMDWCDNVNPNDVQYRGRTRELVIRLSEFLASRYQGVSP